MPEPRNRHVAHSPVMGVQDPASDTLLGEGGGKHRGNLGQEEERGPREGS